MKMKFHKLRAIFLLYIVKILAKILFLEFPPLFSVSAIIEKNNNLLFLDLTYQKGLGLPGGIVQEKETLEEAVKREVFEETGLHVTNLKYFSSEYSSYKGLPTASAVFLVQTTGEIKSSEEGNLIWMNPEKAIEKMYYGDAKKTIKKYLKTLL